ncbi:hypothetical protein BLNAU_15113 [Blattamonas nauphoetae]|uniref:Uncharacterized protein n=1 Tax=Blattamonas nauphoetae TaxID=2049346 RepID=A0ABQ9XEZ4_9EUKA|nr:hypothetical protein BLNAU_15113 [Blattamonas nauphoetae]
MARHWNGGNESDSSVNRNWMSCEQCLIEQIIQWRILMRLKQKFPVDWQCSPKHWLDTRSMKKNTLPATPTSILTNNEHRKRIPNNSWRRCEEGTVLRSLETTL